MIKSSLEIFVNGVMAAGEITLADVRRLQRDILPDGIESRDEADVLIALDRAIADKHCSWNAFAVQTVVERNPLWWDKPTGNVDRVEFNVISSAPTRVAALLSGEVDMIYSVPPQDIARIHAPIGLDIGAISPAEIALSILGELVSELRRDRRRAA